MNKNDNDTVQITISKENYNLLKNRSYSETIKNALIGNNTVQITISNKSYVNLNSAISMLKASGIDYNELLSHDKAIKYILTYHAELWDGLN